jgi:hypothetical protein
LRIASLLLCLPILLSVSWGQQVSSSVEERVRTFSEMAVRSDRPAGAPAFSDVLFSSRWKHPRNASDPHDTFAAAKAFHATQFVWVYTSDSAFIGKAKSLGYGFQCTLNSVVSDWPEGGKRRGRITALDASLITAPWMRAWKSAEWGCCNHPDWRASYIAHASAALSAGADSLQMDDPTLNLAATRWGGCFCDSCIAGFRSYLQEKFSGSELAELGIEEIDRFNYREHLIARGAPSGDALANWDSDPLRKHFIEFQSQSVEAFYADMRKRIDHLAGRRVPMSCNNYGGSWNGIYSLFDFGIAELNEQTARPATMVDQLRRARELGKAQVFTLVSEDVALTRKVIGTLYALGSHLIVPWDVYLRSTPEGSDRFYGQPEDFADLFEFVRTNEAAFDDYEDAFVAAEGVDDDRYGAPPPVTVTKGNWVVSVRAVPGDSAGPVVIHLVNWSEAEDSEVRLHKPRLFPGGTPIFTLILPDGSRAPLEAASERDYYVVQLPSPSPWGLIKVENADISVRQ